MTTRNKNKPILAWWCSAPDRKLRYGDGRKARAGITHTDPHAEHPRTCIRGLHASVRLKDALRYAEEFTSIPTVFRVEVSGDVNHDTNKIAGRQRKYLWAVPYKEVVKVALGLLVPKLRKGKHGNRPDVKAVLDALERGQFKRAKELANKLDRTHPGYTSANDADWYGYNPNRVVLDANPRALERALVAHARKTGRSK